MELFFFISIGTLIFLFIIRKSISDFLFEKLDIMVSTKGVTYVLIFCIVLVFVLGTLLSDQKAKYGHISSSYEQMRPAPENPTKDEKEKPHRWFDINFDIFKF